MSIACVVPTIRPEQHARFVEAWAGLFDRHGVTLVTVWDGDTPNANGATARDLMGADADLIYHRSDVCRNLGFAFVASQLPEAEFILTLDDDCFPRGDTIADHLATFERRVPLSWLSSSPDAYTRGFPYGVRDEARVMVSHGVWHGNADWDAQTQIANNNAPLDTFYRGPVPRGVLFPFCGMNVMIRRAALPLCYFAPMGPRASRDGEVWDRFGDIWLGVCLKRALDTRNWAMVSGYAAVEHTRASDVQVNLRKEAVGLQWNELFWQAGDATPHPYFARYAAARARWADWMEPYVSGA
jgi:reversibly glycosylated polypeptide/UDP-arabinopyranose mutase